MARHTARLTLRSLLLLAACGLGGCLVDGDRIVGTRETDAPLAPGAYLTCDADPERASTENCHVTRVAQQARGAVSFETPSPEALSPLGALFAPTPDPTRYLADLPLDEGRRFLHAIVQREPRGVIVFLPNCMRVRMKGLLDPYVRQGLVDPQCETRHASRMRQFLTGLAAESFDTLVQVSNTYRVTPVSAQWVAEYEQAQAETARVAEAERERYLDIGTTLVREFHGAFPALTSIVTNRRINYGAPILGVMYSQKVDVSDIACGPVAGTRVICRWRQTVETTAANELYAMIRGDTPLLRDESLELTFEFVNGRWSSPELQAHLRARTPVRPAGAPVYETLDATKGLRDGLCSSLPMMSGTGQDFVRAGSNCM